MASALPLIHSLGIMKTIDTSSTVIVNCNRCHAETNHAPQGVCKKTDHGFDEASRTHVHFAETYTLLQCQVCGQGRLQVVMWNSENDHSPPSFFPPPECRRPPQWLEEIDQPMRVLLNEVHTALDAGMYAIALMGVRSVLDVWVSSQTTGRKPFPEKLENLMALGTLSARQVETLNGVFQAGSAASHRGYAPSLQDALAATEAVENLLHQDALVPRINAMTANTPHRGLT
jgi:hypothetical protein